MIAAKYSGFLSGVILSGTDNSIDFLNVISSELTKTFSAACCCFILYDPAKENMSVLSEYHGDSEAMPLNIINNLKRDEAALGMLLTDEACVSRPPDEDRPCLYLPVNLKTGSKIFAGVYGLNDDKINDVNQLQTMLASLWLVYEKVKEAEDLRMQLRRSGANEEYVLDMIQKMKSPLNAISGFSNIIMENEEKAGRFIRIIGNSSDELLEIFGMLERHFHQQPRVPGIQKEEVTSDLKAAAPDGKTILVAEDDDVNYLLICQYLKDTGYNILRAENGLRAVQVCQSRAVDLVLMDIAMPEMDGIDATIRILAIKPETKIIIQTAHLNEREKILSSGCLEILAKPFRRQQLLSVIESYI